MKYDVIVIGGGPAGLAAASAAREGGAGAVLVLERESRAGGILNQCIHDGFGLIRYREALTGPEYALRAEAEARERGVTVLTDTMVTEITRERVVTAVSRGGLHRWEGGALVLATGCRERTRGAISIPGARPAGVFTAGVVQNLVNVKNVMIGKRIVILGSGDIGLIMARRLTLEGAQVLKVVELMRDSGGLQRNIRQCLQDFGIPLHTGQTVSRIIGERKLTAVEISAVDESGRVLPGTGRIVACDALVLSVGLIPENELAGQAGIELDEAGNGTVVDAFLQTGAPGVFSCGNCHRVMDLADYVSRQGEIAGHNAAVFAAGRRAFIPWEAGEQPPQAKGVPDPDTLICVRCPKGCRIRLGRGGAAEGFGCARGEEYARQELTEPVRTLTMTLRTASGRLLPARTDRPIPLRLLKETAAASRAVVLPDGPVRCGQVLAEAAEGASWVAAASLEGGFA